MNKKPNSVTLGAVHTHTHTHTGSFRGLLNSNKIIEENIKTREIYMIFFI